MPAPGMYSGITTDDAMNLAMSAKAVPLYNAVKEFIANEVEPVTEKYFALGEGRPDRWQYGEGQLEVLKNSSAKREQKDCGTSSCQMPKPVKVFPILTTHTSL